MRSILILALLCAAASDSLGREALSLKAAIETTRAMGDGTDAVFVSPDGQRYAVLLIRGDVQRNGVEAELLVGGLNTLAATRPRSVVKLFTSGLGAVAATKQKNLSILTWPRFNCPVWLDDGHVGLTWQDKQDVLQKISISVDTQEVTYLTEHETDVLVYGQSQHGSGIYAARKPFPYVGSRPLHQSGFSVTAGDAWVMLNGLVHDVTMLQIARDYEYYVTRDNNSEPRLTVGPWVDDVKGLSKLVFAPKVSPDGRRAIVLRQAGVVPEEWEVYGAVDSHYRMGWESYPHDIFQLFVVDVQSATAKALWNAPASLNSRGGRGISWSPDGREVLVISGFIPQVAKDSTTSKLLDVAVVNVSTGDFDRLPLAQEGISVTERGTWISSDLVELVRENGEVLHFERNEGRWQQVSDEKPEPRSMRSANLADFRVDLRQDGNTPPKLFAVEKGTGSEEMIYDLNPGLKDRFRLGTVQTVSWADRGHDWKGRLFYPVDYQPGHRYPLVIQTHGLEDAGDFTLYGNGPGLGPGLAVYLAQPLANRGVAVLQVDIWKQAARPWSDVTNIDDVVSGYAAAAKHLAGIGVADPEKVGLEGFSRTNWHVHYALVHSDFEYAAAIGVDGIEGGYLQAALSGWERSGLSEDLNGAAPFAEGIGTWMERSPAFNARRVRTPLQLIATSGGHNSAFLSNWEMFSRLRHLKRPVEYYIAPNIMRGSHGLQNPRQVLAVQRRALDWWLFWLKGEEDGDPRKGEQYARWRELKEQYEKVLSEPRPPLLRWTATPIPNVASR